MKKINNQFKEYLSKVKFYCKNNWLTILKNTVNFVVGLAVFISACVTIFGLVLIHGQLNEINAQPNIKINFHLATSSITFGPNVSDPIQITLIARNDGPKVASYWRVSLIFCKDINVITSDYAWNKEDKNQYDLQSTKTIPPYFLDKLAFYSDNLDSVGNFTIIAPNKNNSDFSKSIPIAEVVITGDYPHPNNYLVLLTPNTGFSYRDLVSDNGRMVVGYGSIVRSCFDIDDQENLLK